MYSLPFRSTKNEFYCAYQSSLCFSEDLNWVVGNCISEKNYFYLLRENWKTGESFAFDFEYEEPIISIIYIQIRDLLISNGEDKKLILHRFSTGKVVSTINIAISNIYCMLSLKNMIICGGQSSLGFVDLNSMKEVILKNPLKVNCQFVKCMEVIDIENIAKNQNLSLKYLLLVGGWGNSKLNKFAIPQQIIDRLHEFYREKICGFFERSKFELDHTDFQEKKDDIDLSKNLMIEIKRLAKENENLRKVY